MSQPDLTPAPVTSFQAARPKPKATIYTALLAITLAALLLGCLFLWLEIKLFGGFGAIRGRASLADRPTQEMFVAMGPRYSFKVS